MINPSTGKEMPKIKLEEVKWNKRSNLLKEFAKELLENGFKVIVSNRNKSFPNTTYFNFTLDGKHFGYAQQTRTSFWEFEMASVHEGTRAHGTGTITYNKYEKPTLKEAGKTLTLSREQCIRRKIKPYDRSTFGILDYEEVIL